MTGSEARDVTGLHDIPWQWHRNKRAQAIARGVSDAIDGITRPEIVDTCYRPGYWRDYRKGRRDYLEAAERNQQEPRIPRGRTR